MAGTSPAMTDESQCCKLAKTSAPASQEAAMDTRAQEIRAEDINPRFNWGRALPALGIMGVDFEERVDYRRLHRYRLSRVHQTLGKADPGALPVFDRNTLPYLPP